MDLSRVVSEQVKNVTKTDNKNLIFRKPSTTQPTTLDIKRGKSLIWEDTSNNKVYLCYNFKGTIVKVELT